jgi:hypothetical protein
MRSCEKLHREYDQHANGKVQTGSLPDWMHVSGDVAWSVFKGPYSELPKGWSEFMKKVRSMPTSGPPGDVYMCDPMEHDADQSSLLTILWVPVRTASGPQKAETQRMQR